ncbi:MAG: hypothetical protein CMM93_00955 [Rickettsiales bacterium]|nr:hypothetical protein [Rickettsiales bacterium]|tara:strand:+ start:5085 stop:6101 length:1017 start_codon:yes stop_codon:yes gene_type:complete
MSIRFHIDHASESQIVGWAVNIDTGAFPEGLALRLPGDTHVETIQADVQRPDVQAATQATTTVLGFSLNLFDLANRFCATYSITQHGAEMFAFDNTHFAHGTMTPGLHAYPEHAATAHQILLFYAGVESRLGKEIQDILVQNPHYLDPHYLSGIGVVAVNLHANQTDWTSLIQQSRERILIYESQDTAKVHMFANEALCERNRLALYAHDAEPGTGIETSLRWLHGMPSTLSLRQYITTIAAYQDLFFTKNRAPIFIRQSGNYSPTMAAILTEQRHRANVDLIVMSSTTSRLSDMEPVTVWCDERALRFVLDCYTLSSREFIYEASRRGLRIRYEVCT